MQTVLHLNRNVIQVVFSMSSEASYPPINAEQTPSDGEFPMIWENYTQIVAARQKMLQALLAFYLQKEEVIDILYEVETSLSLPHIPYVPKTAVGQNALTRYNSVVASYKNVLQRYKSVYNIA